MRILVAGSRGQLARALVEAADANSSFEVVALGRPQLDLLDQATLSAAFRAVQPDLVINASAYTAVDKAETDASAAFAVNRDGAGTLASLAARNDCPIIHISTDYVFDGTKAEPYVEDDPVSPANTYGRSKLEGETAVGAANPRHVILRTAWLYAPYGLNFLRTISRLAKDRRELRVVADQHGNPTYVPHLANAVLTVASQISGGPHRAVTWGIYHATAGGETSWAGFATEIIRAGAQHGMPPASVSPISTPDYPTPAKRPANSRLDSGKLARIFGVRLPPWEQGVRECMSRLAQDEPF